MCYLDDLEPCEVCRERQHIASKEHNCGTCRRTIREGEAYLSSFAVYDGEAHSHKMCSDCTAAREEFGAEHGQNMTADSFLFLLESCIGDTVDERRWTQMLEEIRARGAVGNAMVNGLPVRGEEVVEVEPADKGLEMRW